MPERSDGPSSFQNPEAAHGGADAVNDTPTEPTHGAGIEQGPPGPGCNPVAGYRYWAGCSWYSSCWSWWCSLPASSEARSQFDVADVPALAQHSSRASPIRLERID